MNCLEQFCELPNAVEFAELIEKKASVDSSGLRLLLNPSEQFRYEKPLRFIHEQQVCIVHQSGNFFMVRIDANWKETLRSQRYNP